MPVNSTGRMMIHLRTVLLFLAAALSSPVCAVLAQAPPAEAEKESETVPEEDLRAALEEYDERLSRDPDDPVLRYNRAVTLYRMGDYSTAAQEFLASLGRGGANIEEKSIYNTANSRFRMAQAVRSSDPRGALNILKETAQYYRRAMELAPGDMDPKHNYEITLKEIRDLEKMMEKRQDEQQQQDQQQDDQKDQQDEQQDQKQQQDEQQDQKQQQDEQPEQDQKKQQDEQPEQDQKQQQDERQQQDQRQEDQQRQREEQERKRREQKEREDKEKQSSDREPREGEPGQGAPLSPEEMAGSMDRRQAEMLLMMQQEEEESARARKKEARKAQKVYVIKDW